MLNSQKYNNNNNFTKDLSELIDEAKNVDPNDIERIKQLSNELKNLMSSDKAKSASNNLINKLTQIRGNISKTLISNTKMGKDLRAEFESLAEIINKMTSGKINFHVSDVQGIIKKSLQKRSKEKWNSGKMYVRDILKTGVDLIKMIQERPAAEIRFSDMVGLSPK